MYCEITSGFTKQRKKYQELKLQLDNFDKDIADIPKSKDKLRKHLASTRQMLEKKLNKLKTRIDEEPIQSDVCSTKIYLGNILNYPILSESNIYYYIKSRDSLNQEEIKRVAGLLTECMSKLSIEQKYELSREYHDILGLIAWLEYWAEFKGKSICGIIS